MGLKEERQLAKAAQQQEKNRVAAEKLVMEARHLCYLNSGLDAILLKLNEAIKIDTNSYYAYTMKAVQVYLHTDPEDSGYLQKKEEAQLSINTAFKIKPNSPYVVYNKWKMENPGASSDRVEAAMKRVLSLPAETLLDEIAYAAAHKTCGRKADAIAQYRKILGMKEYAKNFDVLASLAEVLYEEGRFAEAFEIDKIAVKVEPKFAVGFGRLGHSLGELGQHKDAIVAHKRELKLAQTDEDMASAHNGIAVYNKAYG
ncbi:MAG UNVERIFIED_CONTAM: hypothetical protein LVQ98_04775 [Rickettsiaceae bacterium]|jgi:tetratricopeptide (TPR) repeat protein